LCSSKIKRSFVKRSSLSRCCAPYRIQHASRMLYEPQRALGKSQTARSRRRDTLTPIPKMRGIHKGEDTKRAAARRRANAKEITSDDLCPFISPREPEARGNSSGFELSIHRGSRRLVLDSTLAGRDSCVCDGIRLMPVLCLRGNRSICRDGPETEPSEHPYLRDTPRCNVAR